MTENSQDIKKTLVIRNIDSRLTFRKILNPEKFKIFWSIYPRKIKKDAARKSWNARMRDGSVVDEIILAAQNYAKARNGSDQQYTLHPSTFLNGPWEEWIEGNPDHKGHDRHAMDMGLFDEFASQGGDNDQP